MRAELREALEAYVLSAADAKIPPLANEYISWHIGGYIIMAIAAFLAFVFFAEAIAKEAKKGEVSFPVYGVALVLFLSSAGFGYQAVKGMLAPRLVAVDKLASEYPPALRSTQ